MRTRCVLLGWLLCLTGYAQNQRQVDSLLAVLPNQPDTLKTLTYAKLCWELAMTDQQKARQYGLAGVALARRIGYTPGEFDNLRKIGVSYGRQANFPQALHYFLMALPVAERLPDSLQLAKLLSNIGMIYSFQRTPQKSLPIYERALHIYQQKDDRDGQADTYFKLGETYGRLKQYDKGTDYIKKSLTMYKSLGKDLDYGMVLSGLGWILHQQGRYAESIPHDLECLRIMEANAYQDGIGNVLNRLAIAYVETGQYQQAQQYGLRAITINRKIHNWQQIKNTELTLFRVYTALGDRAKAEAHFTRFEAAQDSVFGQQRTQAIAEVETRYQTQLKDHQIASLHQRTQLQRYLLYAGAAGGLLLLVVLGLLYNRYQIRDQEKKAILQQQQTERALNQAQQEKMQLELDLKHRELASSALLAYQKNEMLGELKQKVDELLPTTTDKAGRSQVSNIQKFIQSNLQFDEDWTAFQLHFKEVHPRFFEHLQTHHPDLTPHELKLAAYTRINLSNKEVARLLNVNTSSVEMSRYRLKKKLNLDANSSLTDYIQRL